MSLVTELKRRNVFRVVAAYLVVGAVFSPFWVGVTWACVWVGLRLYGLFRPIRIAFTAYADELEA